MSSAEHHATVDKGLKMKIKRKNLNNEKQETKNKKDQNRSGGGDMAKTDTKIQGETSQSANGMLADKTSKLSLFTDKERSPKSKQVLLGKKEKGKGANKVECAGLGATTSYNGMDSMYGQSNMEPSLGETASGKRECIPDPYEFNAKVEDGISSMPMKKIKLEKEAKVESPQANTSMISPPQIATASTNKDAATDSHDVAVATEPDCLGPCEPGTQVTLAGIVWHESENGVLVVNVTWRGKTYVGTLLDATRHDWAPPRFNCDSPTSEFESRTPKGRGGKRRGASNTPVNDTRTLRKGRRGSNVQPFTAPPSPAKSDASSGGLKRKGRPQDIDLSAAEQRSSKRSRSASQIPTPNSDTPPTDAQGFIECPEPNCNKKYRHANGLKYHQSHAHSGSCQSFEDAKEMDTEDLPLSVVKNSVKRERESKNSANKKDLNKDCSDKSDSGSVKKTDKEDDSESKECGDSKTEAKCDNSNASSKKRDSANSNSSSKLPVSTSAQHSNSSNKVMVSQNNCTKSSPSGSAPNGQGTSQSYSNNSNTVHLSSQSSPLTSSSALTNTVSLTSTTISSSVAQSDTFKSDKLVDIKPKITSDVRVTKPNRPIVPAPAPQVLANVQVTHSNLTPVMSHAQMSPQLKPIQPKPTIMGEPQNINPALVDFNKDRKKVQKKKPSKDGHQPGNNRPDQPTIKIERSGVIKTNPLPTHKQGDQGKKDGAGNKDISKHGGDSHRSQNLVPQSGKNMDMSHSRMNQNPNLLKVGSPLQVTTPDNRKTPVSDDVQSPAYSDISDANESSASPAAPSDTSPQKHKEDREASSKKEVKTEPSQQQQGDNPMVPHYNMYSYYGQQYNPNMSPGQKSNGSVSSGPQTQSTTNPNKEVKNPSAEIKKPSNEEQIKEEKKPEEKEGNRNKGIPLPPGPGGPGGPGGPPHNMSPQQMHDYQNWYAQQMYIQSLPRHVQYQYMTNGWYQPMDHVTMQQMMEEQRRAQVSGEPGRGDRDGGPPRLPQGLEGHPFGPGQRGPMGPMGPMDPKRLPPGMVGRKEEGPHGGKPMPSPSGNSSSSERNDSASKSSDEKNIKDITLREKQNENHQILKENIDLKNEMDKNRQEIERYKQADEIRRYKMYQEQKMIEEKKKMELARKSDARVDNMGIKAPGTRPIMEHGSRSLLPGQRQEDIHRDNNNVKNMDNKIKDAHSRESSANKQSEPSKSGEDKSKTHGPDKHRSETPQRNPADNPMKRPSGSSSKSASPSTSINSSSVPGSPSYPAYVNSYPYVQNHQFMNIEQSHPLYRAHSVNPALVPGYPGYIHPSQLGFRPGSDEEKDKLSAQKSGPTPVSVSDSDPKKEIANRNPGGPFYGNVHKIHELSEKGRPRSRNSSPGPVKPTDTVSSSNYDKLRDYTNSPPTQRHVHTHHHTHVLQPGIPQPALQHPPGFFDPYGPM